MKKIVHILFLGLILSCNSNDELQGTWIGAYTYSNDHETTVLDLIPNLITFENDSIFIKNIDYDYQNNYHKGTYIYKKNIILDRNNSEMRDTIILLNKDSLVFKGSYGTNNIVYKKLENSLKSKSKDIKLVGKRFLITSKNYKDTLNFINDSLAIFSSDSSRNPGNLWERFNHNGFDILFMEYNIPLVIRSERNGKIILTGFYKKRQDFELIELK